MFKIVENRTFTHDVPILTPIDGGFAEETLKVTFNYIEGEEAKRHSIGTPAETDAFLDRIVARLDDVVDDNGMQIVVDKTLQDRLLRVANVRQGILAYYFAALAKVKEGN